MVHELVHETVNIKGWDIVGSVDWKIGKETELPFEDHQPDKTLHYIEGYDKAGTLVSCIGEVVDGTVVDVFFKYLIANASNILSANGSLKFIANSMF